MHFYFILGLLNVLYWSVKMYKNSSVLCLNRSFNTSHNSLALERNGILKVAFTGVDQVTFAIKRANGPSSSAMLCF